MENVEAAAAGLLRTATGKHAGTRIPNPRPAAMYRVQRTGGSRRNMIQERPTLLVECWGATDSEAWALTAQAHEIFSGRTPLEQNGIEFEERDVSSPVNYPDPSTASPRYTFTVTTTVNLEGTAP